MYIKGFFTPRALTQDQSPKTQVRAQQNLKIKYENHFFSANRYIHNERPFLYSQTYIPKKWDDYHRQSIKPEILYQEKLIRQEITHKLETVYFKRNPAIFITPKSIKQKKQMDISLVQYLSLNKNDCLPENPGLHDQDSL